MEKIIRNGAKKQIIPTQEELSIIKNALEEIFLEGEVYETDNGLEAYNWDMDNIVGELYSGASKIVFCPQGADYVVKAPITGTLTYENRDEDEDEYDNHIDYYSQSRSETYCVDEYNLYLEATKRGIEKFFAYIQEITSPIDERIFIQEKVNLFPALDSNTLDTLVKNTAKNLISDAEFNFAQEHHILELYYALGCDADILFTLYDIYPLVELQALNNFIKDYDINDLTYNNMGVRDDNTICFFDYSGYYENV